MASPSEVRIGLATRMATVDGIRVQEDGLAQGSVKPPPGGAVAVIVPDPGQFMVRDTSGLGGYALSFVVQLIVSSAVTTEAQRVLDSYMDTTSARSAVAAVEDESIPLGGGGEYASFLAFRNYGNVEYAGTPYFGVEMLVGVAAQ